ncbi:MAG: hypothetical protein JNK35_04900 [Phycisphaerae bacterium]|nr:hypothetical protein [Phycisphaerae bacterium]
MNRWMISVTACATLSLAVAAGMAPLGEASQQPAGAGAAAPAKKATLLDKLKPLAGTWEMTADGKKQVAIVSKVTSAGSVYCETMFPGSDHEMTNMFHMDGDDMVITHYCAMGNQPRMRCKGESAPGVFVFTFDQGTNVSKGQPYMGHLKLTIVDKDTIKHEWESLVDGKPGEHKVTLELSRKKD